MYKTAHRGFELAASLSAVIGGCVAPASCEQNDKAQLVDEAQPADGPGPGVARMPWAMSQASELSQPLESLVETSQPSAGGAGLGRVETAEPDLAGLARRLWGAADGPAASRPDEGVPVGAEATVLGSTAAVSAEGSASSGAMDGAGSAVCTLVAPESTATAGELATRTGEVGNGTTTDTPAPEPDLGEADGSAEADDEAVHPLFDDSGDAPVQPGWAERNWRLGETAPWLMPTDDTAGPRLPEPRSSRERLAEERTPGTQVPEERPVQVPAQPVLEGLPLLTHGVRRAEPEPTPATSRATTGTSTAGTSTAKAHAASADAKTRSFGSTVESLWLSWPPRPAWLDKVPTWGRSKSASQSKVTGSKVTGSKVTGSKAVAVAGLVAGGLSFGRPGAPTMSSNRQAPTMGRVGWVTQAARSGRAEPMDEAGWRAGVAAWLRAGRHWEPSTRFTPLIAGLVAMACVGGLLMIQFGAGRVGPATPRPGAGQEAALIMPGLAPDSLKMAGVGSTGAVPALVPAPAVPAPAARAAGNPGADNPVVGGPAAGSPAVAPVVRPGSKAPLAHQATNSTGAATRRHATTGSKAGSHGGDADENEYHSRHHAHRSSHNHYVDGDDDFDDEDLDGLGDGLIGGLTDTLTDTLLGN